MPRKSHRRRRKKIGQACQPIVLTREMKALEEQEFLLQESLRRHINRVLTGRRMPQEEFIIERLKNR